MATKPALTQIAALNKCVFCRSPEVFITECEEVMAGCSTFWAECEACGARGPISEYKDGATMQWNAVPAPAGEG